MEGQFYRYKTCYHPHTNMAKAALNMLTRTAAQQFARDDIYMNAVDTGWITDERPFEQRMQPQGSVQHGAVTDAIKICHNSSNANVNADSGDISQYFECPIDCIDAAMRILDPIYSAPVPSAGIASDSSASNKPWFGLFLKDCFPTRW